MSVKLKHKLQELSELSGLEPKFIRHHFIPEWSRKGWAEKGGSLWFVNDNAFADLLERGSGRALNKDEQAPQVQAEPDEPSEPVQVVESAPLEATLNPDDADAAGVIQNKMNDVFEHGLKSGQKPAIDGMSRQTFDVDPSAKSVLIRFPAGSTATAALLFDILPLPPRSPTARKLKS